MDARYLLVRGVQGRPVANPHVPAHTRRCLGKSPNGIFWNEGPPDPETGAPRWPAAVPCDEVVLDEPSIRKAAHPSRGDILILRECVAGSLEEARRKLAIAPDVKKAPRAEVK